jgi:metal-sulfur cluster biosynthetic enzyme
MRHDVPCEFPAGYDGSVILERLTQVLDPELDESILDLGFVRSLELHSGHASVALRLPTSWCAVNFAYPMAEDVRHALLTIEGVRRVIVSLGDHCAVQEIEAAVNEGRPFAEAFPGEAAGSLEALRFTFLRKGFLSRQERLLRELREAGCSTEAVCALRIGEVSASVGRTKSAILAIRQCSAVSFRTRGERGSFASEFRGTPAKEADCIRPTSTRSASVAQQAKQPR